MKTIGGLLAGIVIGLVMMGIFGLSWLTGPTVEPLSAYCRGFTEGFSHAYALNAPRGPLGQVETDANEARCLTDRLFAADDWLWKGPLLP